MERVFFQLYDPGNQGRITVIGGLLKDDDFELITKSLRLTCQYGHPKMKSIKQVYYQFINGREVKEPI